jgi:ATP-dependent Clp protease ATP-binding subunit ClpA
MSSIGFNTKEEIAQRESMKDKITNSLKDQFRPEFLNRLDEVVIFDYLSSVEIKSIVDLEISKVEKRLAAKEITVKTSDKVKELLVKEGFDLNLGARPLKRVIQKFILDPLSIKIVTGEIMAGSRILINAEKGKIIFESSKLLPKFNEPIGGIQDRPEKLSARK